MGLYGSPRQIRHLASRLPHDGRPSIALGETGSDHRPIRAVLRV